MDYKGYKCKLNGVYKVVHGKKLYSLLIYKDDNLVMETDWIYETEERAFKDAKDMIKENRFDTEIIRRNTNKEIDRSDNTKELKIAKKILNVLIIISVLALMGCYVSLIFLMKNESSISKLVVIIFFAMGLLISLVTMYWGVFAKGNYILSEKEKKVHKLLWIFDLLLNKHYIPYREQPFQGTKRTWSSLLSLVTILIMTFLGFLVFILTSGVIRTLLLVILGCLIVNYFLVVSWEVVSSKLDGESFIYKKVLMPIIAIGIFILIVVLSMKIAGVI